MTIITPADTSTVPAKLRIPEDIARTVFSPQAYSDDDVIYPALKWLRNNNPLGLSEVPGYDPIWIVTKIEDIRNISKNPKLFPNTVFNPILNTQAGDEFVRQTNGGKNHSLESLTFMDPPEHTKWRNLTASYFQPGNIAKLSDKFRVMAKESVDRLLSFDGECDFAKEFALVYPLRVVMTLIGVPPEDEARMLRLTQDFYGGADPEEQRAEVVADPIAAAKQWHAALQDFYRYFDGLTAERRKHPQDDIVSLIANAEIDGAPVPYDIANGYYVALAAAGHDTTSSVTAGGMYGLLKFPGEFEKFKADPVGLASSFVEEASRWVCPVKHFLRSASEDVEIRGVRIPALSRLFLSYPSGCRDEEAFERSDDFIIDRKPNNHAGFGFGPHACIGASLARLELKILFEELIPHLRTIELAGPPKRLEANFLSGIKSMPIRFTKN